MNWMLFITLTIFTLFVGFIAYALNHPEKGDPDNSKK